AGEFRVRDARSLEVLGQWNCALNQGSLRFDLSVDGSKAVVPCGGGLRVVDVATGAVIRQLSIDGAAQMMDLRVGAEHVVFSEVRSGSDLYRLAVYPLGAGGPNGAGEGGGLSPTIPHKP